MNISKPQRAVIFAMFGGKCAYCGCELNEKRWHADHVEPIVRETRYVKGRHEAGAYIQGKYVATGKCSRPENDRIDNIYPACHRCNIEKSCCDLEEFRKGLEQKIESLRSRSAAFRHAERYGMVQVVKTEIVFYFETLSKKVAA